MLQLFLSYAHQDADRVRTFAADLVLLLMSRATEAGSPDRFFRKEWDLALKLSRRILPIRLEECLLPATLTPKMSTAIASVQRADLFPSADRVPPA